jgi:hypothetical protein
MGWELKIPMLSQKETETQHLITSYLINLVVCLTIDPTPLPNRAVYIVWSKASSFKWEYPLLSFSSFLPLLPRLSFTPIPPFIFPSITCCRSC